MKSFCVYRVVNSVSKRFYYGSTCRPEKRWQRHKTDMRNDSHHVKEMAADCVAHGIGAFSFEVIEWYESKSAARAHETRLIQVDPGAYNQGESATSVWSRHPNQRQDHRDAISRAWSTPEKKAFARERARKQFETKESREEASRKQKLWVENNKELAATRYSAMGKLNAAGNRERCRREIIRDDGMEFLAVLDAARFMNSQDPERARGCIKNALKSGGKGLGHRWRYKDVRK